MSRLFSQFFGPKFPDTNKYEAQINNLQSNFERFHKYENSAYYQRFLELDKLVHSGEFEKRVSKLKKEKFKDTEAYRKLRNFKSLSKSKDIKSYLNFTNSQAPEKIEKIQASNEYQEYKSLKVTVESPEFQQLKSKKGFKKTGEYKQLVTYKKLKKRSNIKYLVRTLHSPKFKNYQLLNDSERLQNYNELQRYVTSSEFLDFKAKMEDPHRFKKSEEYKLINELKEIEKTPDYIWYKKTKKENLFGELDKWKLTFNEDFDDKTLDASKWITGYFWGKALMNDHYVLANEKQFFKDQNIGIRDSFASIVTKKETCQGKIWDPIYGFRPKQFNYTSGLLSTGQSFRQLYGKFEAKIRLHHNAPLSHSFWMVSEKMAPQIDILRYDTKSPKKLSVGCHMQEGTTFQHHTQQVNGTNYSGEFYIYSLEWSKEKIVWKINGVTVHEQTNNIPNETMYLVFSSNLITDKEPTNLSSQMDIDWVRCYQYNQEQ